VRNGAAPVTHRFDVENPGALDQATRKNIRLATDRGHVHMKHFEPVLVQAVFQFLDFNSTLQPDPPSSAVWILLF
jgi:hypothetical protein